MRQARRHRALIVAAVLVFSQALGMVFLVTHAAARADRDLAKAAIVFARKESPDVDDYDLWTEDAHGGHQYRLTDDDTGDFDPVWSPDGTRIAWVRYPEDSCNCGPGDIWIMNADGTGRYNLTNDADTISRPTWSPDGTQIAFTRGFYEIWVIDADGSDEHRISPEGFFDFDPAWSPDGTRIALVSQGEGEFDLFSMRPDGSDRQQVTHTPDISERRPAWSPDGSMIAFTGLHDPFGLDSRWRADVMQADGSGVQVLVDAHSLDPAWSPSGSHLVFTACIVDGCGLAQARPDGTHLQPLGRPRLYFEIQPDYRDTVHGA